MEDEPLIPKPRVVARRGAAPPARRTDRARRRGRDRRRGAMAAQPCSARPPGCRSRRRSARGIVLRISADVERDLGPEGYRLSTVGPVPSCVEGGSAGRGLLGRPDTPSTAGPRRLPARARRGAPRMERARQSPSRTPPLRLARHDARRLTALPAQDDVLRYLDLLAAHKLNVFHFHLTDDQGWRVEIKRHPRAHRDRRLARTHQIRPPRLRTLGRETARRLLHPGRHPRDRRVRRRAAHHRRPRDRHPRPLAGRHRRVPRTRQHRRRRHGLPHRLGHLGHQPQRPRPHRRHPALLRGRPRGGPRPLPGRHIPVRPHRRRRVPQGPVEGVPGRPGPHRGTRARRRGRAPVLVHPALRQLAGRPRAAAHRLGRDPGGRPRARRRRLLLARLRGRHRGGRGGPRRRHVPRAAGVSGPPPARRPRRAHAHRLRPHPGGRLPLRARAPGAVRRRRPRTSWAPRPTSGPR